MQNVSIQEMGITFYAVKGISFGDNVRAEPFLISFIAFTHSILSSSSWKNILSWFDYQSCASKKKGGIKVNTMIRVLENVPRLVLFNYATRNDHISSGSISASRHACDLWQGLYWLQPVSPVEPG